MIAPTGGSLSVDVPGTAMGFWFNPGQPVNPDSPHAAIAPDNVDPSRIILHRDLARGGPTGSFRSRRPRRKHRRNPAQVTADGNVYCYESQGAWMLLAQMTDANTLRLEGRDGTHECGGSQPWMFTAASFIYKR